MMSIPHNKSQRQLWAVSFVSALPGWVRPDWPRSIRRYGSSGWAQNGFYQPRLDYLESRLVPASILYGNEVALGISPGGAFLTPDNQGKNIGIQFGATDLVYPGNSGIPVSGFAVSVNGTNYLNYSTTIGLQGTISDISTPGTLAYRFVSEAIPDLKITRIIAMPQNSRQILISTSFENTSSTKSFQNIAIMEVEDPNPATYATLNDVVALSHGTFVRGSNSAGLTLALASVSQTAYASAFGPTAFSHTASSPYDFFPSPKGNLTPGAGDPNASSSEDAALRLVDQISSLDPKKVATFSSTLLVGSSEAVVQAAAETLASASVPTGQFQTITDPRKETVASEIINFSQPVVGLDAQSFQLTRNGIDVPLTGVTLVPLDDFARAHRAVAEATAVVYAIGFNRPAVTYTEATLQSAKSKEGRSPSTVDREGPSPRARRLLFTYLLLTQAPLPYPWLSSCARDALSLTRTPHLCAGYAVWGDP
jgi:hypothetical protein